MFSKKATKIDEIFTVDLKQRQIDGEDFVIFFGRLRKINFLKMNLTGRNTKQLNFFVTTLKIEIGLLFKTDKSFQFVPV